MNNDPKHRNLRDHHLINVGGPLDDDRLRRIEARGLALRNTSRRNAAGAYGEGSEADGETPTICERVNEDGHVSAELHVGCGEHCPVLVAVPYDDDVGGLALDPEALAHVGRDVLDLVDEVRRLREALGRSEAGHGLTAEPAGHASLGPGLEARRGLDGGVDVVSRSMGRSVTFEFDRDAAGRLSAFIAGGDAPQSLMAEAYGIAGIDPSPAPSDRDALVDVLRSACRGGGRAKATARAHLSSVLRHGSGVRDAVCRLIEMPPDVQFGWTGSDGEPCPCCGAEVES